MNPLHITNPSGQKPIFKLGLPGRTVRQVPELQFGSGLKELPMPGPNRLFSRIPDNRDEIAMKYKQEQDRLLQAKYDIRFIERQ